MKSTFHILFLSFLLLACAGGPASAQPTPNPPGQISYQGFLTDANGVPLATNNPVNYNVVFRIYNAATGGTLLWAELQVVTVDRGYFTVMLGNGTSVPGAPNTNNLSGLFVASDASDRYLELTAMGLAPGDPPIAPRLRLLATPYSFLAAKSLSALALDASTTVADGNLSTNVALRNGGNIFNGNQSFNNNLGVGVPATSVPLSFASSLGEKISLSGGSGSNYGFGVQSSRLQLHTDTSASDIVFGYGPSASFAENMRIKGTGNVGIGTAAPANKLQINDFPDSRVTGSGYGLAVYSPINTGNGAYVQILRNYGLGGYGLIVDNAGFGSSSTSLLLVRNNLAANSGAGGVLGVALDVRADANSGAAYVSIGNYGPGGYNLTVNGSVGAGALVTTSDARLKKDVQTLTNAVSVVTRLRGVSFDWRQEEFPARVLDNRHHLGFIAQEVEKVLPDVVSKGADGFRSVAYTEVIPLLVEAIKEQQTEIEARTERIQALESRLAKLEAKDKERSDSAARSGASLDKDVAALKKMVAQLTDANQGAKQTALAVPQQASQSPEGVEQPGAFAAVPTDR